MAEVGVHQAMEALPWRREAESAGKPRRAVLTVVGGVGPTDVQRADEDPLALVGIEQYLQAGLQLTGRARPLAAVQDVGDALLAEPEHHVDAEALCLRCVGVLPDQLPAQAGPKRSVAVAF